jgi:hypothetical protein
LNKNIKYEPSKESYARGHVPEEEVWILLWACLLGANIQEESGWVTELEGNIIQEERKSRKAENDKGSNTVVENWFSKRIEIIKV